MRSVCLLFLLAAVSLRAEVDLWRGSMALLQSDPRVVIEQRAVPLDGGAASGGALPLYLGGVLRLYSPERAGSFLRSSNTVDLYFEGPGDFAVERFDQAFLAVGPDTELELEQSWLLMNLREGQLWVDTRSMEGEGQVVLVTPFGRLLAARALWSISIDYEARNERYDFTVACAEGQVRMTDLQGQSYTLYSGQRIAGVGAFLNPAIEIGESSVANREGFAAFTELRGSLAFDALDLEAFRSAMFDLPERETPAAAGAALAAEPSARVPLVIDYVAPPGELTPFRGILRAPNPGETASF